MAQTETTHKTLESALEEAVNCGALSTVQRREIETSAETDVVHYRRAFTSIKCLLINHHNCEDTIEKALNYALISDERASELRSIRDMNDKVRAVEKVKLWVIKHEGAEATFTRAYDNGYITYTQLAKLRNTEDLGTRLKHSTTLRKAIRVAKRIESDLALYLTLEKIDASAADRVLAIKDVFQRVNEYKKLVRSVNSQR